MRLKYYELYQTRNERQKAKGIFCRCPHDLRPHHHGKKRKDASTDSGLGASAQTLVLRRMILVEYYIEKYEKIFKLTFHGFAAHLKGFVSERFKVISESHPEFNILFFHLLLL